MEIRYIYHKIENTINKFSDIPDGNKKDLEKVIEFGISAIGTLEALVDTVLTPITQAKKELFKSQDSKKIQAALIEIATNTYDELDKAQNMVFKFSALNRSFHKEIEPILSKYFDIEEIYKWEELFEWTQQTRAMSYTRVESLIPKIEDFLEARYYSNKSIHPDLTFKDLKEYLNEIIDSMRSIKKDLQLVKSNFLQLSGLKGLTNITDNKIIGENKFEEINKVLKEIEDLVANSRIESALEKMVNLCNYNYPEILKDIMMLQSQYNITTRHFYLGLDNDKITPNKINFGILELVNEIRKKEKPHQTMPNTAITSKSWSRRIYGIVNSFGRSWSRRESDNQFKQ